MRLVANENIPGNVVATLAAAGHDIAWVRDAAPGSADDAVLAGAVRDERILMTFDKDFGELAWQRGLPPTCGVILLRLPMPPPGRAGAVIVSRIADRNDWEGHFSVIEPGRVRMRRLQAFRI